MITCIDFETKDWGFAEDIGSAWPWKQVDILGMGFSVLVGDTWTPPEYVTDIEDIKTVLDKATTIVAHNAMYEAGILKMLGYSMRNVEFLCTLIGSKLYDNSLMSHSLDNISKLYFDDKKTTDELLAEGIKYSIVLPSDNYLNGTMKVKSKETKDKSFIKQIMGKLDELQECSDIVGEYCKHDVRLTCKLYDKFIKEDMPWKLFSKLTNVMTDVRARGIRVDLDKAVEALKTANRCLIQANRELWNETGYFNWASSKQMKVWADNMGLEPVEDNKGVLGYGKSFIEHNADVKEVKLLKECKRWKKALEFCQMIFKYEKNGRVHPEMSILGAVTGRFTCRNPNFQQIPSRDEEITALIRKCFLPDEGEQWISADYSTQEPRIALHLATLLEKAQANIQYFENIEGTDKFENKTTKMYYKDIEQQLNKWLNDANEDAYSPTVDMLSEKGINVTRSQVKTVVLGLMYGKGITLLANELLTTNKEAAIIKRNVLDAVPYIFKLDKYCKQRFNKKSEDRYLMTLLKRKLLPESGAEYKALNKVIQGGAVDQTSKALIDAWEVDIKIIGAIHDSIEASGTEEDAKSLKKIMEDAIILAVPSVADTTMGNNWYECK